ncbi:MAG: RNA polymerase sigma factor [Bryobacteraceae bacterium]
MQKYLAGRQNTPWALEIETTPAEGPASVTREKRGGAGPPAGDQEAGHWFEQFRGPLCRYLHVILRDSAEVEDLVQEAFFRLSSEFHNGREINDVRAWIFRVAHNLAVDRRRRKSPIVLIGDLRSASGLPEPADPTPDSERSILDSEQRRRVQRAINRLSPQERQCMEMRASGLRYREISEILGIGISSVQSALVRAIRKITEETSG